VDERTKEELIHQHLDAIRQLQLSAEAEAGAPWPPRGYYLLWHVVIGMMLGTLGAGVSLLANVVGAPLFGKPPLELIRVYLTFPMGERALSAETGLVLTVGCGLYLLTGALYGIAFHLLMSTTFKDASPGKRFAAATAMGLGLWLVNFYLVLSWLQPLLLGDNWIVRLVPLWVAAATHLAFAWTMFVVEFWGRFVPYAVRPGAVAALVLLAAGAVSPASAADQPPSPGDPRPQAYDEWNTVKTGAYVGYNQRVTLVQRGKVVYDKYCVGCHGAAGDGKGVAAKRLITKPRDFTSGLFKFRSTDSSSLPLESDLHRTITRGLARVSMPAFALMPETEKVAVIEYLKTFYPGWERRQGERVVVPIPRAPRDLASAARVKRGRIVFVTMQCGSCHGNDGRGGATAFTDAWGNSQQAFDFTRGRLKGGDDPEDIYRTFHTGLISIMPAFGDTTLAAVQRQAFAAQAGRLAEGELAALEPLLKDFPASGEEVLALAPAAAAEVAERNSWDLVAYVISLRRPTSTAAAVLGGAR
jgi:mono/diheme cytochrome c family protein